MINVKGKMVILMNRSTWDSAQASLHIIMPLPAGVIKKVERICASFFCEKRVCMQG